MSNDLVLQPPGEDSQVTQVSADDEDEKQAKTEVLGRRSIYLSISLSLSLVLTFVCGR